MNLDIKVEKEPTKEQLLIKLYHSLVMLIIAVFSIPAIGVWDGYWFAKIWNSVDVLSNLVKLGTIQAIGIMFTVRCITVTKLPSIKEDEKIYVTLAKSAVKLPVAYVLYLFVIWFAKFFV
jgi:hypothetical protein